FGMDAHGCMGSHIAHFLGRLFVEEVARGFEWRVADQGPLGRGRWHRHHWHPNFRVVLAPRA
ncbi:MAG: hypothetical protein H6R40_735, partial [Gemmatimonadetes bacterium]|nr:hypothetical protein [Gemmatimonadota bacterium]